MFCWTLVYDLKSTIEEISLLTKISSNAVFQKMIYLLHQSMKRVESYIRIQFGISFFKCIFQILIFDDISFVESI